MKLPTGNIADHEFAGKLRIISILAKWIETPGLFSCSSLPEYFMDILLAYFRGIALYRKSQEVTSSQWRNLINNG
jgi:hypothetical protein